MEIKSFRDLWGFCREQTSNEPMRVLVNGKAVHSVHAEHDGEKVVVSIQTSRPRFLGAVNES